MERGHPFQRPAAGGAHRQHPPPLGLGSLHGAYRGRADLHPFAVELHLAEIFRLEGLEGAQAHMERNGGAGHTGCLQLLP